MTDREQMLARVPQILVCKIVGHRGAWLEARWPSPTAIESWVWGCSRCGLAGSRARGLGQPTPDDLTPARGKR